MGLPALHLKKKLLYNARQELKNMKKLNKQWLLFLILILLLATGLPYSSLYQERDSASVEDADVQAMSIALVNEDEGAIFNGETITFGEAFVKSLDNDENHNWFVVSRGVAESGLNRNIYDMMIVIPNDFSTKALSIESEVPEQVVLNYRINASDDVHVKAEAERTASTILNEFNRRIIDVYFTSIIGNLHEAQDAIGEIVDKQTELTSTYNHNINQPLSNYTNQFGMIKNNTELSRTNFNGLNDQLEHFENRLGEGTSQTSDYLSELDSFTSLKDGNNAELLSFSDALLQFNQLLNNEGAEKNLEQLQQANQWINYQLQPVNDGENIVTGIGNLKATINDAINKVDTADNILVARLDGLYEEVDEKVSAAFREIMQASEDQEEFIKNLFITQDKNIRGNINEQISNLPSLNEADFEGIGLPERTVREIKNVIAIAKGYNKDPEFDYAASRIDQDEILPHYIARLKNHLSDNGITITDTVWIPENEEKGQEFTLHLPEEYELVKLGLTFPGQPKGDYTKAYKKNNKLILDPNEEGNFQLEISLRLKDKDSDIDVFEPVKIGWELKHKYIKKEEIDEASAYYTMIPSRLLAASTSAENEESEEAKTTPASNSEVETDTDPEEDDSVADEANNEETNAGNEGVDNSDNDPAKEEVDESGNEPINGEEDHIDDEQDMEEDDPDTDNGEETEDDSDKEIEKVKVFNNRISHQITEPINKMDDATAALIRVVTNTISPYQQLYATFDNYFGTGVMEMDTADIKNKIEKIGLKNLALENGRNSLYKFFNHTDIEEIITGEMVDAVIASIYREIETPLSRFQENIANFKQNVNKVTNEQLQDIMEEIENTGRAAQTLNANLGDILEQVINWREQSTNLMEAHRVIEANDGEEQMAVMSLYNGFEPLLSNSQSIALEAKGNLSNAETVYETLDTIDNQAEDIEQSGVTLVTQADQLSRNMTDKLLDDQVFATNFADVLANSRLGERENENLYNFLSNPVLTSNEGTITSGDNAPPYFLVLSIFIVVFFTAYVLSTLQQRRTEANQFAEEKSLMDTNIPITIISAGIGVLEGLTVGLISSHFLGISDGGMVLWIVLVTVLITGMLLVATYLLRQLKMLGMFVLLIVLSMYLFTTNAFGTGITGLDFLRNYSPLQYVERLLMQVGQGHANYLLAMIVISGLILIGALANLLVINRDGKGDLEDEGSENEAS